jgi:tetratricopeptide (TPR) repeat protein
MRIFIPPIVAIRTLCALTLLALVMLVDASAARAESRVALVIGNGAYKTVPALPNPPNDAKDVSQALTSLGFQVTLLVDASRADFQKQVDEFSRKAKTADVSMFYYGGHGFQVASRNYLLPVDADLKKVEDIETQTIHLDSVLDAQTGGSGIHLVFLDACRNDPTRNSRTPLRSTGLARTGNAPGFLIAYATQPDNVALDGAGRNSPFASALLNHLATPGLDVSSMMIEVRKDVIAETGSAQVPWDNSSLTRQFYFIGSDRERMSPESLLWQLAAQQRDRTLLAFYLERFPKGPHAEDVRALLPSFGESLSGSVDHGASVEDDLWKLALSSRQDDVTRLYLQRFPSGLHAKEAAALLSSLKSAELAAADPTGVCERLATHPSDATATAPGVDFATLAAHASQAVEACGEAVSTHPDNPHFLALLARATFASGRQTDAVALYRKAADAGDSRAMVSLATLMENGDHAPRDLKSAYALYEKAAARDNTDAAINLGVALFNGIGVRKDVDRAVELFRHASQLGSARATFNLAKLVSDGVGGAKPSEALDLFKRAADLGYPGAYRAAALLMDVGRVTPHDPDGAADLVLECVRADFGDCLSELTGRTQVWGADTVRALQTRLKAAGYYAGPCDGKSGPTLEPALRQWRQQGPPKKA